ncbi:class I SAM-dependent methyltransferase [Lysobacter sp. 1R34A]|uniref:class I SAM-dependent methyltransferase n=1 Tax=Lysobacter sp. 1R34A TaxID=3445786 RepID=UPI003EEF1D7D
MSESISPYDYSFDPNDGSTAARIVRMVGKGRTVLEFGCGYGVISRVLHANGCSVVGIELDAASAEAARPWLSRLLLENIENDAWLTSLGDHTFDVVLASDVIEHLRDPGAILRHIRSLLSPDGELVLSVPNIGHAGVIAELLRGAFDYRPTGILDSTHLRFFTWATLERLLNESGFEVFHRETVDAPGAHEHFFPYWVKLPDSIRNALADHPTAKVFQYLLKARLSDTPRKLQTDDDERLRLWTEVLDSEGA